MLENNITRQLRKSVAHNVNTLPENIKTSLTFIFIHL